MSDDPTVVEQLDLDAAIAQEGGAGGGTLHHRNQAIHGGIDQNLLSLHRTKIGSGAVRLSG